MYRVVILCGSLTLINCASNTSVDAGGAAVVMRVGERTFTLPEVQALLAQQPEFVRAQYTSKEGRRAFLEGLARSELLLAEARSRGLDNDPAVRSLVERLLVQKLAEQTNPPDPTEAELRAAYDKALSEFVKPDRLHVRALFLASVRGGSDREKVRKEAGALHAALLKMKASDREARFEVLARERSDLLSSRDAGGDLGPRTPADLTALVGEGIQPHLATLQQTGTLTEVLETERGFLVLYLRGRQPGLTQSFESAKARLAQRLIAEGRARALEELLARLRKQREVSIDDSFLIGPLSPVSPIGADTYDGG